MFSLTWAPSFPLTKRGISVWDHLDFAQGSTSVRSAEKLTVFNLLCMNWRMFHAKSLCLKIFKLLSWIIQEACRTFGKFCVEALCQFSPIKCLRLDIWSGSQIYLKQDRVLVAGGLVLLDFHPDWKIKIWYLLWTHLLMQLQLLQRSLFDFFTDRYIWKEIYCAPISSRHFRFQKWILYFYLFQFSQWSDLSTTCYSQELYQVKHKLLLVSQFI